MQDRFKFRVWHKPLKMMHYNDFVITSTGYVAPIQEEVKGRVGLVREVVKEEILKQVL